MAWDFSGVRRADEAATATATSSDLGSTLTGLLPQGTAMPQSFGSAPIDYLTAATNWLQPTMGGLSEEKLGAGRTLARHGIPIAAGVAGSFAGPLGAGLASAGGELAGQWAAGDDPNFTQAGLSGALGAGGAIAGRALSGVGRIAEAGVRRMPAAQALGVRAPYETAETLGAIEYSTLRSTVDQMRNRITATVGTELRPVPTGTNKLLNELDELSDAIERQAPAAGIRDLIGRFIQENKQMPQARGLYGALMSDLRQAGATGNSAATSFLRDLTNDSITRQLVPESWLERMLLYGVGGGGMLTGNPVAAAAPLALLGGRAFMHTPPSMLEPLAVGGAQYGVRQMPRNPFVQR